MFNWPLALQPMYKIVILDTGNFCPFDERTRLTIERYENSISPVTVLFRVSSPSAIFFAVGTVAVFALKSFPRWHFAHVSKEIREVLPPFTDRNASTAIQVISIIFLICAAAAH